MALTSAVAGGCSTSSTPSTSEPRVATSEFANAAILDVRTPEEFQGGHLEGATNVDISGADFETQLAGLPKSTAYVVYCRSGNRSAAAVEQMQALGFTNVTDIGGVDQAQAATGLSLVRN